MLVKYYFGTDQIRSSSVIYSHILYISIQISKCVLYAVLSLSLSFFLSISLSLQSFCLSLYSPLSSLALPPTDTLFKSLSSTRTHSISSVASRSRSSRGNEISEQQTSYSLHICEVHVHKDAKKSPLKISHSCASSHQLLHIPASELALVFYRRSM